VCVHEGKLTPTEEGCVSVLLHNDTRTTSGAAGATHTGTGTGTSATTGGSATTTTTTTPTTTPASDDIVTLSAAFSRSTAEIVFELNEHKRIRAMKGENKSNPTFSRMMYDMYAKLCEICNSYSIALPFCGVAFPTAAAVVLVSSSYDAAATNDLSTNEKTNDKKTVRRKGGSSNSSGNSSGTTTTTTTGTGGSTAGGTAGSTKGLLELCLVPDVGGVSVSVSIGKATTAIHLSPTSLQARNECVVCVCVRSQLTAAQCERFAEKLQQYLSSPAILDA
jgi:hypothetical protein